MSKLNICSHLVLSIFIPGSIPIGLHISYRIFLCSFRECTKVYTTGQSSGTTLHISWAGLPCTYPTQCFIYHSHYSWRTVWWSYNVSSLKCLPCSQKNSAIAKAQGILARHCLCQGLRSANETGIMNQPWKSYKDLNSHTGLRTNDQSHFALILYHNEILLESNICMFPRKVPIVAYKVPTIWYHI